MISYEWCCEPTNKETGDIIDNCFGDTLESVFGYVGDDPNETYPIVLVRYDDDDRSSCRSWAYLKEDGSLPDFFADAHGHEIARVPKKFHKETRTYIIRERMKS